MFLYAPNENALSLKSRQARAQRCRAATTKRLLLFLLLVGFLGLLGGLGLPFAFGTFLPFDFTGDHRKDAALLLDSGGIAKGVHGNLHAHANVHGDAEKIDVEQFAADGIGEPVFEDGRLMLAVEIHLKESVVAAFGTQNGVDLFGVHGERDGLAFAAGEDGGDSAGHTQAAGFIFPPRGAGGSFYYYFVLILSHAFYPFLCSHWPG